MSFSAEKGRMLGVVGESGSGKSVTALTLLGLTRAPNAHIEGEVRLDRHDLLALDQGGLRAIRGNEVAMIFQDPYSSLNPHRTVGSILSEPLKIHGVELDATRRRRAVKELMEQVGLNPEHHNRHPHQFSGGQRQRIGIARAGALRPKLVIADEPVSALDVSIQAQILDLLRRLQRELGLTMIFIAHNLAVVRHMCERVGVMYLGKLVETGDADTSPRRRSTRAPAPCSPRSPSPIRSTSGATRPRSKATCPRRPTRLGRVASIRVARRRASTARRRSRSSSASPGGTVAACHYPLTRAEIERRVPEAPVPAR